MDAPLVLAHAGEEALVLLPVLAFLAIYMIRVRRQAREREEAEARASAGGAGHGRTAGATGRRPCSYCGTDLEDGDERCPSCGFRADPGAARPATRGAGPLLLAVALAAATLTACSTGPSPDEEGPVPRAVAEEAVLGLCEAAAVLPDDPAAAETAFFDRAHDALHEIAGAVQELDRAAAAELLTAKEAVEAGFRDGEVLPGEIERLIGSTGRALGALGLEAPACPA
ncbi:MAG: zinc ribbon domain-containing protein [Actinobacteria bacterium]|nr:zinc ribbon domain-containing protein [Actinomycetota bacterium]